jgi:hypothetical protein
VQTFSGPNPMVLVTIIYCLRFETSLFVVSYDSQGLRWRYSTPPPHGSWNLSRLAPYLCFITPRRGPRRQHLISTVVAGTCLPSCCRSDITTHLTIVVRQRLYKLQYIHVNSLYNTISLFFHSVCLSVPVARTRSVGHP